MDVLMFILACTLPLLIVLIYNKNRKNNLNGYCRECEYNHEGDYDIHCHKCHNLKTKFKS